MARTIAFADLKSLEGQEIGVSDWLEVDQARIDSFAAATGDRQWIHVDVERANREMGGTIAHGYLTLSLIPYLSSQIVEVEGVVRGINYGCNKVRFSNPVKSGARVRLRQKLLTVEPRAGGLQVVIEAAIEIEGETRAACVAETLALIYDK